MRDVTPDEIGGSSKAAVVIGPFGSSLKTSDFADSGVPLIFVRDIRAGDFSKPRAFVSEEKARNLRAHIAMPGDIVVTKMGDPPGDVAVYDGPVPAVITADCIRLRPAHGYDTRYLLHAFKTPQVRQQVLGITSGAAQKKVSLERFRHRVAVPVPSLPEQRRIAAILDRADALRAKRRQVLGHLESLAQSIFHGMFGEPGDQRWEAASFGELIPRVDNGSSPNCESRPAASEEWGVLKLGAVTYGVFRPDENKAYLDDPSAMKSNEVRAGDVLMTRKNTRDLVGAVALVDAVRPRLLLPDLIFRLHLDPARLDRRYFHALMMNPRKRAAVRDLSSGSAASMPNISKARLATLPLEVPPLDLQKQFAAQVERINAQRDAALRALAANDECFASLQSRAFRGEL